MEKETLLSKYPWPEEIKGMDNLVDSYIKIPFKSDKNLVWRWLSDTSRFNRALGMKERQEREEDGKLIVTTMMMGKKQEWIEHPWKWKYGESMVLDREYIEGMGHYNHTIFYFEEGHLYIYMGFIPNGWIAKKFLELGLGVVLKDIAKLVDQMDSDAIAGEKLPSFYSDNSDKLSSLQAAILEARLEEARAGGLSKEGENLLRELISSGDDMDLYRLRPLYFIEERGLVERDILKDFLVATHFNILNISWDIICPSCLGPRTENSKLVNLLDVDHCDACKVKFETNVENAVEVTFRISKEIREVKNLVFCAAEPAKKDHIKFQWKLNGKQDLKQCFELNEGHYAVRVLGESHVLELDVTNTQVDKIEWNVSESQRASINTKFELDISNIFDKDKTILLEEKVYDDHFLRPKDIFALPEFKKYFGNDGLGEGIQLYLGEQTIVFTDIVSSTKFYELNGDKAAFTQIKDHFKAVYKIFEDQDGVIIKTIGDAVMASFPSPLNAIRASEGLHDYFDASHSHFDFQLRISAHLGKVIGVNQNTGIDYFGNTVNLAAKLQAIAEKEQLGVSRVFFAQLEEKELVKWNINNDSIKIPGKSENVDVVVMTYTN